MSCRRIRKKKFQADLARRLRDRDFRLWTDYPIAPLGDTPRPLGVEPLAPVRRVTVVSYDHDKYVTCRVEGLLVEFKVGYLYPIPQRSHQRPFSRWSLNFLGPLLETLPHTYRTEAYKNNEITPL